ncbi:hypothetical protein FS749_010906, partial [Ceratobasidium sp. UAMH 11750]
MSTSLEEWMNSLGPKPISLSEFKNQAHKMPAVFEAPVRHVSCHRLGVHEYLLVHCSVTLPTTQWSTMTYFRLERDPAEKGRRILKLKPAVDTIRMSANAETLHQNGSLAVRGYLVFDLKDNVPRRLMLKDILEIYEYLAQTASTHNIFGTTRHWLCLALLECLRGCRPCFGGQWLEVVGKDFVPKQENTMVIQAKTRYLREKHEGCCHLQNSSLILKTLVAEATTIGAVVSNMVEVGNQAQISG